MTELREGAEFGPSSWIEVPQEKIDAFAEATGDHQWIHVDPERAAAGPFGTTIAHGYLTLSLLPAASYEAIPPEGDAMAIRSEEHTSELQSLTNLVCRLLLEKKKNNKNTYTYKAT